MTSDKPFRPPADGVVYGALDVGGTHVTGALIAFDQRQPVVRSVTRVSLQPDGTAEHLLSTIASCADSLAGRSGMDWAVAVPGPFDHERGVAQYRSVGKFDALYGVDLRGELSARMQARPGSLTFVNDAEAFLIGEWSHGAASGHVRVVGITLGTGVGSAFLADGTIVADGPLVPPEGRADLLQHDGRPLEDTVSRRAIIARYRERTGQLLDVRDIAARARGGEAVAQTLLDGTFRALGQALDPWLLRFAPTLVVVGGSMTGSWDLLEPAISSGLTGRYAASGVLARAAHPDSAALVGAVQQVRRTERLE
ncbi:ROK family protein [Kribbella flavida DSM 17836]|uniref:ROK family protein n=1 Tax=Kribbella flavida (strain DSM 17836 / JCM 10339 / NBRC 14399) TaxID=479435 RepID=D2PLD4_KRIFD|nr:ROK family protein [Kribbella flavida]ADB30563.1 ROK family protein [Kribbella flavida DSM 17836]